MESCLGDLFHHWNRGIENAVLICISFPTVFLSWLETKQKEQSQKLTTHLIPLPSPDMNESLQASLSDFFIPEQEWNHHQEQNHFGRS